MYSITLRTHFDAAHHLPNHPGKCGNIHGHRWNVEVSFKSMVLDPKTHMVQDFKEIKGILDPFLDVLDHQDLNDIIPYPTAEEVARWFWSNLCHIDLRPAKLCKVRIYESPDAYAEYTAEEH